MHAFTIIRTDASSETLSAGKEDWKNIKRPKKCLNNGDLKTQVQPFMEDVTSTTSTFSI